MNILFGVGNEYRGDDGVGSYIAKRFKREGWKPIDGMNVPENYVGVVTRERRGRIVIVDATEMGLEPGAIRIVPRESLTELAVSTHTMPLSLMMDYLKPHCDELLLVGIQPKDIGDFIEMSEEVKEAAEKIISSPSFSFPSLA